MTLRSTYWRAALKWPRTQRLEFLDVPELGARYLNIPKTGSGSVRMQVYRQLAADGDDLTKETLWEHTHWVRKDRIDRLPERFTFAFARDPFDRLASLYRHKIVQPHTRGSRISPLFAVYGRRFRLGMAFPDFVAAVAATPDEHAEKHFRSQSWFLFAGDQPTTDFVGRMERFDDDWALVCERTGFEPMGRAYNQSPAGDVPWDRTLLDLVAERYAEDLARLGYEKR